ncbi:Imm50 family immunity protein [Streptomyces sp. H27-D2]|uniref:Imm50 family immunity protein n=1 Tax=Streptomyces sp. H27-D2 TaxID=3046304 RepID=UPI002DBB1EE0|nr:Imm50 family immunity protein [Streptomyces sp. H27-D2]MEC4014881.1 Imm50 family immunity protein [Streptomyces sp. H27-D2]
MTLHWAEQLVNPEQLTALYLTIPSLHSIKVRSIHLDRWGPTLTLRFDLPEFPHVPRVEWQEPDCDTFQCQVQFLAVADVAMTQWQPPVTANITMLPRDLRRLEISVEGLGVNLSFSSSDSLIIGHMGAFKTTPEGADSGRHCYLSKLDAMRFGSTPAPHEKTFNEHI